MLLVNGSPTANKTVWQQTLTVNANTEYEFEVWITSLYSVNPALLQFSINGIVVGDSISADNVVCNWRRFSVTWNSMNNTSATIAVVNKNTVILGNDFAIDNISFATSILVADTVRIQVEDIPVVMAEPDSLVCPLSQVQLRASGANSYTWSPATGLSSANSANPVATITGPVTYYVTAVSPAGCKGMDSVVIGVLQQPNVVVNSSTAHLCKGDSLPLKATGATAYKWSPVAGLSNAFIADPVVSPASTTWYKVVGTGQNGCTDADSVLVQVSARPVFAVTPTSARLCMGESLPITASGGTSYSWFPAAGLNVTNLPNVVASPLQTTAYRVAISDSVCKVVDTLTVSISVNKGASVSAISSNDISCDNPGTQLVASGAQSYIWQPATGLSSTTIANPVAQPTVSTVYIVTGTDTDGCKGVDSVSVIVNTSGGSLLYQMPNAFTPNGDGNNDCFGMRKWGSIDVVYFQIFNRWGQVIYSSASPNACWDGTVNGQPQTTGNYMYRLHVKTLCGEVKRSGSVMLVR
jgi:gliding motility-associated-like protein